MASLNWIGKEAVVNHDKEVPFKLLKKIKSISAGDQSQNLVVHGDNLEALKALMPYYVGKVKCIYIDPPYNTGNEGWVYNDKVNSPKIRQWLGQVAGRESEDLTRHDKWLCMMYPRLKLLRELLTEDGIIFVSMGNEEIHHLRLVMDEIFLTKNFVSLLVWENKEGGGSSDSKHFKIKHEYILCYGKNKEKLEIKGIIVEDENRYRLSDKWKSSRGKHQLIKLNSASIQYSKSLDYPIEAPDGSRIYPSYGEKQACWRWSKQKFQWGVKNDFVVIKKDRNKEWAVYTKQYFKVDNECLPLERTNRPMGVINKFSSTTATKELEVLFGRKIFDYSKPYQLVKHLIELIPGEDIIVLDSFAGSGTTGHAVLDLNKDDGGNRKFIMVEMEDEVAKKITAERVKRSIKKYDYKDGFEYCELGKALFNQYGHIDESCDFKQFATYIYFTETQCNINAKKIKGTYIGEQGEIEYHLLYQGRNRNDLNKAALEDIGKSSNRKVVYADRCMLDEDTLVKHNITFKQIPYEVKIY